MRFPASGLLALSNGPSREAQNPVRTRLEQICGNFAAERHGRVRRIARSRSVSADAFLAVGGKHASIKDQFSVLEPAPCTKRKPTAALQSCQHCPFRGDRQSCVLIHKFVEERKLVRVRREEFNSQRTLSDGWQHNFGWQNFGDPRLSAQPVESRLREDHCVALACLHLAQARIDVASHLYDFEIGAELKELRRAPQTARPDPRTLRQLLQQFTVPRDERIARIFARKHNRESAEIGQLRGDILHAVHSQVRAAFNQRVFEFFGEDPANPDLLDLSSRKTVTGSFYDDDLS